MGQESAILALFRDPAARPVARILLTLASGAACAAIALLAALFWSQIVPYYYRTTTGAVRSVSRVSEEMLAATFILAGWVWLILIWKAWSPVPVWRPLLRIIIITTLAWSVPPFFLALAEIARFDRGIQKLTAIGLFSVAGIVTAVVYSHSIATRAGSPRLASRLTARMVVTGVIIVAACIAALVADRLLRPLEEEYLIAALILIGAAAVLCVWLPLAYRGAAEPVQAKTGEINVRCPKCGYSLVGLAELRCPECGERFTVDGIIRAQGYAKPIDA